MRCQQFESVVSDLACEKMMEAGLRNSAIAHAQVCARCASRLSDERTLTKALHAAADAEQAIAPDRVKSRLMEAFGQPRAELPVIAPGHKRRLSRWALAAAAAILALASIPVVGWLMSASPQPPTVAGSNTSPSPAPDGKQGSVAGSNINATEPAVAINNGSAHKTANENTRRGNSGRERKVIARAHSTRKASGNEAVTDFIPLTYLSDRTAIGSGTVVRVNMRRSTLMALGLPMNVDRAGEMIKADLVVSDDGLARAIRIVY